MHAETVVITGASAGVGRATAREFARRGARIGLIARGREGLEATRREVEALGGRALDDRREGHPQDSAPVEAVTGLSGPPRRRRS
jgi:NADP-dependent 3-hydroxy acid dehydrogenase YdfG